MSGGGQQQSTVQNKDPWGPSQPALQSIISSAGQLFNSGAGSQMYNGPTVAPQSDATRLGLANISSTAQSQFPTAGLPYLYGQNQVQQGGLGPQYNAPLNTYGGISSGANGITTGQQFGDIASAAGQPTASSQYLTGIANGSERDNPYIKQMLDSNNALIANRVNSSFAGLGRYGSGGHAQALGTALATADNPVLAQAYSDNQNRQLSASQAIDAANRSAQGTQISALGGQTGVQGQNISNQLAGAGGQTGIYNFGQGNAANWAGLLPSLQQSSYVPGNMLVGSGAAQDAYNQQNIDAQKAYFDQAQQLPWNQLTKYLGAVTGTAPLTQNAGTTTGNATLQNNPGFLDYAKLFAGGGSSAAAGGANSASALLGLLSDRNEKTDIKKLGTDETTGLPLYAYRYKDDPKTYPKIVGPMAQDVEKALPGSTETVGGKMYIKPETFGILAQFAKKAA